VFFFCISIISINALGPFFNSTDFAINKFFQTLQTEYTIHRIDFKDKQIRFVETGLVADDSPLILFIHGAPGNWDAFKSYLADYDLRKKAKLISMDRIGYGDSSLGESEIDIAIHAESALNIIQQYNPSKVIVVGHSYGGPVAGKLAADHPDLISGIFMIAPLIDPYNEPVAWYAKISNTRLFRILLPAFCDVATDEKMAHAESLKNIEKDWKKIKSLTMHYHGELDNLAPFEENVNFSKNNIPSEWLTVIEDQDAGHLVVWNKAASIKKLLIELFNIADSSS